MEEKVIQLKDLQPGSSYLVRARAINRYDVASEWSETYTLNLVKDDLKPSIPAAPTVNLSGPQKVVVIHDNKKKVGGDLEFDVVAYKVFTNTTQTNTGGTLIHTMAATRPGSGIDSFATINVNAPLVGESGATIYFYVTAVDSAGNESDPSDATTGKAITYFDSAYISDLTADRIRTGTLQANQQISVGTTAPIIIKSNATSPRGQIYIGTTINPTGAAGSGYKDTQTAFYVDSTGKFSLKDKLYWDGTTLTIDGYFQIGDEETTISGNQIRSGHLISNNYISNVPGQPDAQSDSFTTEGTWIDLEHGSIYSESFYITGTGDVDSNGDPINGGTAVFKGELFASRGIFSDFLSTQLGYELSNPEGLRFPTLVVESTNTDDGYLVLFKNTGTKSGVEFYVKQNTGDGTGETQQKNWRRGSLSHLSGTSWPGGVLRLASYSSSTGKTPGLMHIYAEPGDTEPGEIHLDADRVYISKFWVKENFANDALSNFWKDPDIVTAGQRFFQVGNMDGSGIEVKKDSNGLPKVSILNYEIIGVAKIVDDSRITIKNVSDTIDLIKIGKNVDGTRDGIYINSNNYWTLNNDSSNVRFRIGDTSGSFIYWDGSTLNVKGSITVTGGDAATQTYAQTVANNAAASISVLQKLGTEVTGAVVTSLGEIYSAAKTSYSDTDNGWYLGWINPTATPASSRTPAFNIGNASKYLKWDGSALIVSGTVVGGSEIGSGSGIVVTDGTTYNGININNRVIITANEGDGSILFYDPVQSGEDRLKGAVFDSQTNKFAVTAGGRGIAIGSTDYYPFIEAGYTTTTGTGNPRIRLSASANVFLQMNATNFTLQGGSASTLSGIPNSNVTTKFLAKNADNYLVWADGSSGSGGTTYQAGVGIEIVTTTDPDTIRNTGYRMQGSTTGGTRISDANRIGFVNAPSSPQDGDIWVEF